MLRVFGVSISPYTQPAWTLDAAANPPDQEAHCVTAQIEGDLPSLCVPASRMGDLADQPDSSRLGELLCVRKLQQVFCVRAAVGGKEDSAPPRPQQ